MNCWVIVLTCVTVCSASACGGDSETERPPVGKLEGDPGGSVTYEVDGVMFRIDAKDPENLQNISTILDGLSDPGEADDEGVAVSRNGKWLTLTTNRFDCEEFCLVIVNEDFTEGQKVIVAGEEVEPDGRAAISDDGNLIVYPAESDAGDRQTDLFAITRNGETWSAPVLLTGDSTEEFNTYPVLNHDADLVLFDCGPVPFSQNGTDICSVTPTGGALEKVVDSEQNPLDFTGEFLTHHGDFFVDGTIAFEADWDDGGEQIWVLRPGADEPTRVDSSFSNDNTPCVLPKGYIASLWLQREGGQGDHELKIMAPDASESLVVTPDVDIADVGMSCHETIE